MWHWEEPHHQSSILQIIKYFMLTLHITATCVEKGRWWKFETYGKVRFCGWHGRTFQRCTCTAVLLTFHCIVSPLEVLGLEAASTLCLEEASVSSYAPGEIKPEEVYPCTSHLSLSLSVRQSLFISLSWNALCIFNNISVDFNTLSAPCYS